AGYDWCIIRLGIAGVIRAITVDTNHFRGNHPAECSFDAAELSGGSTVRRERDVRHKFAELLPRSPLVGHAENELMVRSEGRFTRSEEHTSEFQSRGHLVCRLLLEKKKRYHITTQTHTATCGLSYSGALPRELVTYACDST